MNRNRLVLGLLGFLLLAHDEVSGGSLKIEKDGMARINGRRAFLLGLYENPKEDEALRQVASAGFNLVRSGAEKKDLDRLQQSGMGAWINTGMNIDFSRSAEERKEKLRALLRDFSGHPALLVWEVPDEALWNSWQDPWLYRVRKEMTFFQKAISSLPDAERRKEMETECQAIADLYRQAEFAAGEQRADALWKKLGQSPPEPAQYVSAAPRRAAEMSRGFRQGYEFLKSLDADHPVWMNHAPRNQIPQLAAFNRAADIVGCDIYPAPLSRFLRHSDLTDQSLSSVGAYTVRMARAAPGKPVWMVLQGFGWGDIKTESSPEIRRELHRPTRDETRFMAYDAIVRGARGILYWGSFSAEKDSVLWRELLDTVGEIASRQEVWSAPDAPIRWSAGFEETLWSVDQTVQVLPKQVGQETWLLVVNESPDPLVGKISGLKSLDGKTFVEKAGGLRLKVEGGGLRIPMRGYGVRILQPDQTTEGR